jgi:hypothetical protein
MVSGARSARAAYACAVIVALGLAYFVSRIPIQISDCLGNMLHVQHTGFWELMRNQVTADAYLRPLLWAQIDLSFELARGQYLLMYKGIHGAQLVAAAVLFVNLLRPTTPHTTVAALFGIAVLFGAHTFAAAVHEAFPINTFMTILVCCLLAANLSFGAPATWRDVVAPLLFAFAALTVESGLLVWVILAAGWIAGCRGVSTRGLTVTTAALLAYAAARLVVLDTGVPALVERSSGFGFRVLDPPELVALFGERAWLFYLYNIASQIFTVLFAEPKGGVWLLTHGVVTGELLPRDVIPVVASTGATLLIGFCAWSRRHEWRRRVFVDTDRLLLIFAAVLVANAVISYPYTKEVIVSPAGGFHALAAAIAFAEVLRRTDVTRHGAVAAVLLLTALSAAWAVRLTGIHYQLREKAFVVRNDWMRLGPTPSELRPEQNPAGAMLVRHLYEQAVEMRVAGLYFRHPELWKYFEPAW